MNFFELFEAVYVISLPERADRRRGLNKDLARSFDGASIETIGTLFDACRPESPGSFPTVGIRGCFESHLQVLRAAEDQELDSVLIVEDDASFPVAIVDQLTRSAADLSTIEWHSATFGCNDARGQLAEHVGDRSDYHWTRFRGEVQQCHCVAFHGDGIARTVTHLEKILTGEPGDPMSGPMHVDGAYNVQAWTDPEFVRMVLSPPLVRQRISKSDISPSSVDRYRFLEPVVSKARRLRDRLKDRPQTA